MTRYIGEDIGGYRVIEPIGQGGMAKVFKAYQPLMDRFIALKILPEYYADDVTYIERFKQEAKIISRLEHRHILPVYDFGEDRGITYLAMRYLRGGTLKDVLLRGGGCLELQDTSKVIGQLASALDYAHEQGIVHRDVKPSNVLIDANGDTYLMDFGIAKVLEGTTYLTGTGGSLGTPAYMSPEQGAGKPVDGRSDQYSLGIMLYEMLTGRTPYQADTPYAVIVAHMQEPLPLPSELNPAISEEVERVIFKALAKQPDDRYPTVGSMALAFEQVISTTKEPETANLVRLQALSASLADSRPSDEVTRDVRLAARQKPRPLQLALIALGVIAVMGIGIGALWLLTRPKADEKQAVISGAGLVQTQQVQPAQGAVQTVTPMQTPFPSGNPGSFAKVVQVNNCGSELCLFDYEGKQKEKLPITSDYVVWSASNISGWSPDGQRIVISACLKANMRPGNECQGDIYSYNRSDSSMTPILVAPDYQRWPAWSPDGQWIAFEDAGQVALVRPDGTGLKTFRVSGVVQGLAWSPDSQHVAWLTDIANPSAIQPGEVWMMNRDGSSSQRIGRTEAAFYEAPLIAWSPDGKSVAVRQANGQAYLINTSCSSLPAGCDAASQTALGSYPWSWLNSYYPQWAEEMTTAQASPTP